MSESVLTAGDVAKLLGCSRAQVTRLCNGSVPSPTPLPFFRIGKRLMFNESSIRQWLLDCESAQGGK
jgi:predicted DNA-binding transcriptional regulator AlpA